MGDVLFLAHRIPYPPNKGDKIRSWNILKFLLKNTRVHLGCFIDDIFDERFIPDVQTLCGESCFLPLNRKIATVKSGFGLFSGDALSNRFYTSQPMHDWVRNVLREKDVSTLFIYSSTMAQFALPHAGDRQLIMDFVDVDSEKWRQYSTQKNWPLSWVYGREARKLAHLENQIARRVDASLFVSKAEAEVFKRANPDISSIYAVSNGVDVDVFDPSQVSARDLGPGPHIVFTGAMDYWANADAACWFVQKCWAAIRKAHSTAQFHIVGANPRTQVEALTGHDGVTVTGRVDDVKPYICAGGVSIAPMRIARGIQNKVLEAMALARPVVATSGGAEGIDAQAGTHLQIADTPDVFVQHILHLLKNKEMAERLGHAARVKVCEDYSWGAQLAALDDILALRSNIRDEAINS